MEDLFQKKSSKLKNETKLIFTVVIAHDIWLRDARYVLTLHRNSPLLSNGLIWKNRLFSWPGSIVCKQAQVYCRRFDLHNAQIGKWEVGSRCTSQASARHR